MEKFVSGMDFMRTTQQVLVKRLLHSTYSPMIMYFIFCAVLVLLIKNDVFELDVFENLKVQIYIDSLRVCLAVSIPLLLDVIAEACLKRGHVSDGMSYFALLVFLLPNITTFMSNQNVVCQHVIYMQDCAVLLLASREIHILALDKSRIQKIVAKCSVLMSASVFVGYFYNLTLFDV